MRRTLPLVITFVAGFLAMLNSYIVFEPLNNWVPHYLARSFTVSNAWAVALGAMNLMRIHGRRISRKQQNWGYSIVLIVTFVFFLGFGLIMDKHQANPFYNFVFNSVQPHLSATMFSVLTFYIASSAFRAFRMRSVDSTMMLVSAFIIMLGAVPIGEAIWSGFPVLSEWVMNTINTSSLRAMSIGLTLGGVAQSMRNLVGVERGHLAGE